MTRESFSEFNRQSRNFQHSLSLVSTLGISSIDIEFCRDLLSICIHETSQVTDYHYESLSSCPLRSYTFSFQLTALYNLVNWFQRAVTWDLDFIFIQFLLGDRWLTDYWNCSSIHIPSLFYNLSLVL